MKKFFLTVLLSFTHILTAFDKLSDDYCVYYGNRDAQITITQYFSFTCPHCVALFRKEFNRVKEEFLNSKRVCWIFHPVPMDLLTVQGMECLKQLDEREKKIFLEAILEELVIENPKLSAVFMQKSMEILDKPIEKLQEKAYLSTTDTFEDAFLFLKQESVLKAVPAIEINDRFFAGQVPEIKFIQTEIQKLEEKP